MAPENSGTEFDSVLPRSYAKSSRLPEKRKSPSDTDYMKGEAARTFSPPSPYYARKLSTNRQDKPTTSSLNRAGYDHPVKRYEGFDPRSSRRRRSRD